MLKYIIPWIWLWTTGFLLSGCKPAVTPYDEQLIQAEVRIGEKPDSVYRVLKTIDKSTLTSANLALYHLLWTEAEDNEQTQTSFTAAQWKLFDKAFDSIFPGYRKRIVQSFPDLPINYQRICCLVLLDIKVSRMANIMEIQTNSLSVYKNTIKKKYFHCCDNTSLQILLRGLLN